MLDLVHIRIVIIRALCFLRLFKFERLILQFRLELCKKTIRVVLF